MTSRHPNACPGNVTIERRGRKERQYFSAAFAALAFRRGVGQPITLLGVLVFMAAVAASMSLGRLHEFHSADSILPVLVSLQRWTPFFWQQDRFGMVVPLLAMPIR